MKIGQASSASGVSQRMIRHYEKVGLIPAAARRDSGYRDYDATDVHTLAFIGRARDLGFGIEEIRQLLGLWQDRSRPSKEVKRIALAHVTELDEKIRHLTGLRDTLEHLARCCHGDHRPDCPILGDLEGKPGRR